MKKILTPTSLNYPALITHCIAQFLVSLSRVSSCKCKNIWFLYIFTYDYQISGHICLSPTPFTQVAALGNASSSHRPSGPAGGWEHLEQSQGSGLPGTQSHWMSSPSYSTVTSSQLIAFPQPGIEPGPCQWEPIILTIRPPENSLCLTSERYFSWA